MIEIPMKENVQVTIKCNECETDLNAELEWKRGWILHVHPCPNNCTKKEDD